MVQDRVAMILEILYGLAIASGVEQVAPRLFGYDGGNPPCPWFLGWTAGLAFAIGIADWISFFRHEPTVWSPVRFLLDIAGITLIFILFCVAHSIVAFAIVLAVLAGVLVIYPVVRSRTETGYQAYDGIVFRLIRAAILVGIAVYLSRNIGGQLCGIEVVTAGLWAISVCIAVSCGVVFRDMYP
jgi:hypothetical protein